jgi:hypothetical protein
MKNVVKLDNYFTPEELEAARQKFVNQNNNERYRALAAFDNCLLNTFLVH